MRGVRKRRRVRAVFSTSATAPSHDRDGSPVRYPYLDLTILRFDHVEERAQQLEHMPVARAAVVAVEQRKHPGQHCGPTMCGIRRTCRFSTHGTYTMRNGRAPGKKRTGLGEPHVRRRVGQGFRGRHEPVCLPFHFYGTARYRCSASL